MKATLPRSQALVAALAALVTVGAAVVVMLIIGSSGGSGLASSLPASATTAYFARATVKQLEPYHVAFPALATVSGIGGTADLALLRLPDGTTGWVAQPLAEDGRPTGAPVTSSDRARALLGTKTDALNALPAFRALLARADQQTMAAFVDLQALPPAKTTADQALFSLRGDRRYALVQSGNGTATVRLFGVPAGETFEPSLQSPLPLPTLTPMPSFLVTSTKPRLLGEALAKNLSPEQAMIVRGLLAARVREALGDEVSIPYDLLPLLERPTVVASGKTASGRLLFLIRGSVTDDALWARASAHLLSSAASPSASISVTRRTFEKGFTQTAVQAGDGRVEEVRETLHGWTVRGRGGEGSAGFFLAARGREFIVTDDRAWLTQSIVTPSGTGTRETIAEGVTDRTVLRASLASTPFSLTSSGFGPLREGTGPVHWSIVQSGPIMTLLLRF